LDVEELYLCIDDRADSDSPLCITKEAIEWMCNHWPRLKRIQGLWFHYQGRDEEMKNEEKKKKGGNPNFCIALPEAVEWIQKHQPHIEIPKSWWPWDPISAETEEEEEYFLSRIDYD